MSDDLVKRLRTPVKVMSVDEMADRIKELEAKLAKALSFIDFLDENYRHAFGDTARYKIKELYAELKGQDQ